MELTQEQEAVVNAPLPPGHAVMVQAFAGTGKTSTIAARCKAAMDKKILYLAFNRSLMESARDVFRDYPHVRVETFHSWALSEYMKPYEENDFDADTSKPDIVEAISVYDILDRFPSTPWLIASGALSVLQYYWSTTDDRLQAKHTRGLSKDVPSVDSLALAQSIWKRMQDGGVPIPHDAYLKIVALGKPVMPYDWIMVDEVQDLTPLQMELVVSQKHAGYLLFGDVHQTLYGFRYACDPVAYLRERSIPVQTLRLTRTFRFGPRLARLSSLFLQSFKDEQAMIQSAHDPDATRVLSPIDWTRAPNGSVFVFRSNRGLVQGMFDWIERPNPPRFHVLGMTFVPERERQFVRDFAMIRAGRHRECKDPVLRRLKDLDMAGTFFKIVQDYKNMHRLRLFCEMGGKALDDAWARLEPLVVEDPSEAQFFLGTVHQTKGLEYDHVILGPDFPTPRSLQSLPTWKREGAKELANILYVAMTRAIRSIYLNEDLAHFCSVHGEDLDNMSA